MQLLAALTTLASLGLAAARSGSRLAIDQIEYGFCPGSPQPGSIDSIVVSTVICQQYTILTEGLLYDLNCDPLSQVKPFPISLKEGSSLALSAQVTVLYCTVLYCTVPR